MTRFQARLRRPAITAVLATPLALLAAPVAPPADSTPPATPPTSPTTPIAPPTARRNPVPDNDRMEWWRNARFGMFIHWGVYSVPAGHYNDKTTPGPSEWLMESLHVPTSAYETFADKFTAANYDPAAWAALAEQAGMKYVVITSRHHDGFCLWDSKVSTWDVTRSPAKKDLLAPLALACRAKGLHFGLYYSILDWHHPDYTPRRAWNDLAANHTPDFTNAFVPYVHAQVEEVITNFKPDILWFDGEWEDSWTAPLGKTLYNRVRELKPDIIVNNRVGKSRNDMAGFTKPGHEALGDFCTPEQEVPATGMPGVDWETCMTMNDSWGYKLGDSNFKSASKLVRTLCDVVSKGGNLLLNVGPTPDGRIPAESIQRLRDVGAWMAINADAIHGTTASPFPAVSWGRVTTKGFVLNLIAFDWPADERLLLPGLQTQPVSARVLARDRMMRLPRMESTKEGLLLTHLGPKPPSEPDMPIVIQLTLQGPPVVQPAPSPAAPK